MENLIGKLFDWDKIPMKLIFLLFIISAILLFTPEQYIQHLKLESFISEYGKFIGITFITSIGFLLVSLISYIIRIIRDKITNKKVKKAVIKNLQRLTNHEIFVLREFFINGKSTLQLPFLNETVVSLENKMIIYKASNTGTATITGQYWPYSISEYALPLINDQLLKIPTELTEENRTKIQSERPEWANYGYRG